jgi:protocatechuate 3,4-dioxygenase beta subunit
LFNCHAIHSRVKSPTLGKIPIDQSDRPKRQIPGGIVEGRVTDSAGKPILNTSVGIYGPAHPRSSAWVQFAKTDAKGRYQVRVPAGKNYVYCMDSRYSQSGFDVTVQDGKSITQNFVLTPNLNPGR